MQFGAFVTIALGPWLVRPTVAQTLANPALVAPTSPAARSLEDEKECVKTPDMPALFYFKRKWAAFFNIIEVKDRYDHDIGFVQTWLFNWKDPFGYPGATFYLKSHKKKAKDGIWELHPQRGADGWGGNASSMTSLNLRRQEELGDEEEEGFIDKLKSFFFGNYGWSKSNRFSGTITGKFGFFNSDMSIMDCNGDEIVHAWRMTAAQRWYNSVFKKSKLNYLNDYGTIRNFVSGKEVKGGRYYTKESATANVLTIQDNARPAVDLARIDMPETCNPFPPFCAKMGTFAWFWYGDAWEGRIVQPGYNDTLGGLFDLSIRATAGSGTDMRFLTLYSAYQFSNTRWSPLMGLIVNIAILSCCGCLCWSCCATAPPPKSEPREESETTKLIDAEMSGGGSIAEGIAASDQYTGSPWNCCTRRGGRTIAIQ